MIKRGKSALEGASTYDIRTGVGGGKKITNSTQVWIFLGNSKLRELQKAETNMCGSATKKRQISRTSLPINLHF